MTEPEKNAVEATAEMREAVERLRALIAEAAEADARAFGASGFERRAAAQASVTS